MSASRFSSDALELFFGSIPQEENQRQKCPLEPVRAVRDNSIDFKLLGNNFQEWLRGLPENYPNKGDLLANKAQLKFTDLLEKEITHLKSLKTQFGIHAKFSVVRNDKTEYMEHYFKENEPAILNKNNEAHIFELRRKI